MYCSLFHDGCILDYHVLVPDVTERKSAEEIRRRYVYYLMDGGHQPEAIIFRADLYLDKKNEQLSAGFAGRDRSGEAFLPWCLMRCAEAARLLGIGAVLVDCSRKTWQRLRLSRNLIQDVTDVRLSRGASLPASGPREETRKRFLQAGMAGS